MNLCRSHACECLQKYLRFININLTLLLLIIYSFPEYQKLQNAQNYNLKKITQKTPKWKDVGFYLSINVIPFI